MKNNLSQYFSKVAYKKLSAVESDKNRSHQHEFNGVGGLRSMLGEEKQTFHATQIYFTDNEDNPIIDQVELTWYDARESHATRTEYRLYYKPTVITQSFKEGCLMILAQRPTGEFYIFYAPEKTTSENQLKLLFGINDDPAVKMVAKDIVGEEDYRINYISTFILEQLGIEVETYNNNFLDSIFQKFPEVKKSDKWPNTKFFSQFARDTLPDINAIDDPDMALCKWMEREEVLFKTLEKYKFEGQNVYLNNNIDSFIKLSLTLQNRRKSRVGFALENHLEAVFLQMGISYSRNAITEGNSKPDFIFPLIENYRDQNFPAESLYMLGAKSTCKDRWRQVLVEAARIQEKHLLTLEPGISKNQTDEMRKNKLHLVVPKEFQSTYTIEQQKWLLSLKEFTQIVA